MWTQGNELVDRMLLRMVYGGMDASRVFWERGDAAGRGLGTE